MNTHFHIHRLLCIDEILVSIFDTDILPKLPALFVHMDIYYILPALFIDLMLIFYTICCAIYLHRYLLIFACVVYNFVHPDLIIVFLICRGQSFSCNAPWFDRTANILLCQATIGRFEVFTLKLNYTSRWLKSSFWFDIYTNIEHCIMGIVEDE